VDDDDGSAERLRVELGADASDADRAGVAGACVDAIAAEVGVKADVEVVDRGSLTRSGYKQVRLVDS